jgi:hypothetical protein
MCFLAIGILILTSSTLHATIINPSFEVDGNLDLRYSNATGWEDNVGSLGSAKIAGFVSNTVFCTNGSRGAGFSISATSGYDANSYTYLRQSIDLTNIDSIKFDAELSALNGGIWDSSFEADFYVDSTRMWTRQSVGTFMNQPIDVSGLAGMHTIEFRLQSNISGTAKYSNSFVFDNVRAIPVPEPSCIAFFCTGLVGLLVSAWWRRK